MVATRILHYSEFLHGVDYHIILRNTDEHVNADVLSPLPELKETMSLPNDVTVHQLRQISILSTSLNIATVPLVGSSHSLLL